MFGLGTIINVGAVILGGIIGLLFGKKITERFKEIIFSAIGIAVIFISINGVIEGFSKVKGGFTGGTSLMLIACLLLGGLTGELLNINGGIEKFGKWLKQKSKSENDKSFINGFLTATFTTCIGAMAVIGSIQDGISGNFEILLAKSLLDGIILIVYSTTYGKGSIFCAIPILLFQGSITIIFHFLGQGLSESIINNIDFVGSAMIFMVGINILFKKEIKVANFVPALIFAVIWGIIVK